MNELFEELEVYKQNEAQLIASDSDKFVLIKGRQIVGLYNKQYDAISDGYKRFGNAPFFIKQLITR